jgi:hypothetical protein
MSKTIHFDSLALFEDFTTCARDVQVLERELGRRDAEALAGFLALTAAPSYRAALRTAFPQ